jgi:predicted DNA binding CopG/RHH family protein
MDKKTIKLTVRVTEEDYNRLLQRAERLGIGVATAIRMAVREREVLNHEQH